MRMGILVLAFAAGASTAMADTVKLDFKSLKGKTMVVASHGTVRAGEADFAVLAGGTSSQFTVGQRIKTFCIDVSSHVVDPDFYEVKDFDTHIGDTTKSDAIKKLYTFALTNNLDFSQNDTAATFQAMIWEVLYDYNGSALSLDTQGGAFKITSAYAGDPVLTAQLAAAAHGGALNGNLIFTALDSLNGGQDQMYLTVVPLPGAAGLAAVGLAGVVVTRRRRA